MTNTDPAFAHRTRTNLRAQPFSSTNDWDPETGEWAHTDHDYLAYFDALAAQVAAAYNPETDAHPTEDPH